MYMQDHTGRDIAANIGNLSVDTSGLMTDATGQDIVIAINNLHMAPAATDVTYDNSGSALSSDNVQDAIDELSGDKLNNITNIDLATDSATVNSGAHTTVLSLSLSPGIYLVNAGVSFPNNATGIRRVILARANTSTNTPAVTDSDISLIEQTAQAAYFNSANPYTQSLNVSTLVRITATFPNLYIRAYQDSGASMNVSAAIQYVCLSH